MTTFLVLIYLMFGEPVAETVIIPEGMAACQKIVEAKREEAGYKIPDLQFFGCVQTNAGKVA